MLTGIALIEVISSGENRILVSPGANGSLSPRDLGKFSSAFEEAGIFVTQLETPMESVIKGVKMAKKAGAITLLNPAPAQHIPGGVLAYVDYLVPNETETETLTGLMIKEERDVAAAAAKLLDRGVKNVVITLGRRGAFFKNREDEFWAEGFPVKSEDTTAAGDAFVGAFACGLAEERKIPEILKFANAAGALTTTRLGAQPSLPSRKEVEKLLRKKKGRKGNDL
jgi:ribokinase